MPARSIMFDPDCDKAAEALGGYARIDISLEAVWDGLQREPRGFDIIQTDWGSVRYVRTKRVADVPELIWQFVVDQDDNVLIVHVEECEQY